MAHLLRSKNTNAKNVGTFSRNLRANMSRKGIKITITFDMTGKTMKDIVLKFFGLWKYKCEDCGAKYRIIHLCRHD